MFGPQPPKANAGVTADDRAAERITTPSSVAESFFMKNLLSTCVDGAEPQQVMFGMFFFPPNRVAQRFALAADNRNET
jgi:hypothetical protein